ncbi:MAG: flagellar biosynthesis anti-sigma factor FlgM [Burkholderiales bacterium]|nr:flagellar biosynthesis anti-sigma factor FlgM [Burkholderiales bacterium]
MKIDSSIKSVSTGAVSGGGSRAGKGAANASGSGSGDRVQLSPLSSQLQAIESSMADTPVVDSARVAEIRTAIAEGRFKVNPDAVADHLLQTARELLRSRLG